MRFDDNRQSSQPNEGNAVSAKDDKTGMYETPGYSRALHFIWPDGKRMFLPYSYLQSGECSPDETTLTLTFSSHLVTIKGMHLEAIYQGVSEQTIREITCVEERYTQIEETEQSSITEIKISVI